MYWKKGTSRLVLVIPALGICLKFARIRPWYALRATLRYLRQGSFRFAWRFLTHYPIRSSVGVGSLLLRGVVDNWREWWFSAKHRHPVLARTYLTLGVVNVQEAVAPNALAPPRFSRKFESIVGWETINSFEDLHAFSPWNFGVRNGKIVVVDYAGLSMQKVVEAYADKIHDEPNLVSPP